MSVEIPIPEANDLRIAVLVPSHTEVKAGFCHSLANMVSTFANAKYEGGKKEIEVINVGGSMLPEVRHRLVAEAMKWGATHALWLDSDMMFPRDTLQCLLRHNLPIVGANYPRRQKPCIPTGHLGNQNGGMLWTEEGDNSLVEVKHLGGGVMLVDMRVYDALELPFFMFEVTENKLGLRGEDVYFCMKAKEAGIPVFCDQELSQHIGHIGEYVYTNQDSIRFRDDAKARNGGSDKAAEAELEKQAAE